MSQQLRKPPKYSKASKTGTTKFVGTIAARASPAWPYRGYHGRQVSWPLMKRQPKVKRSAPADQRSFPGRSMPLWSASTALPNGKAWGVPKDNLSRDYRTLPDRAWRQESRQDGRQQVQKIIGVKAETPAAANNMLRMVHLLMQHAIDLEWRRDDPTDGVRKIKNKSEGFARWEESQIDLLLEKHKPGTRAHPAF